MNCNLAVAMMLAKVGIHIFPCDPETKKPVRGLPWRDRSTTNANSLRYYWSRYFGAIVGIDCAKSGMLVLDMDVGHVEGVNGIDSFNAVLDAHGELPEGMPCVRSAGGGFHVYGKQPADREPLGNRTGIWPGVDIRGSGGYIIAPGSIKTDGTFYETIAGTPDLCEAFAAGAIPHWPEWLIELIERQPVQPERAHHTSRRTATTAACARGGKACCATSAADWPQRR